MSSSISRCVDVAIDLSYAPARMLVSRSGVPSEAAIMEHESGEIRTGADLLGWISGVLDRHGLQVCDVGAWTIGMGPGAFSQIRMLSATVQGLTFDNDSVKVRGLPSGMAFASALPEDEIEFSVIYQHMKNTIIACNFKKKGPECIPSGVFSSDGIPALPCEIRRSEKIVVCGNTSKIPDLKLLEDRIVSLEKYPVRGLLSVNPGSWSRESLRHPVYARPAAKMPVGAG